MKFIYLILLPIFLFSQTYTKVDSTMSNNNKGTSDATLGFTGRNHVAAKITAKGNYTIDRITIYGEKVAGGSPVMDFVAQIWSHNTGADEPLAQIGSNSSPVNASTFPVNGSSGWVNPFDFSQGIDMTDGTVYWIVLYTATTSVTNYAIWNYLNQHPGKAKYDADGIAPWTALLNTYSPQARVYQMDTSTDKGFKEYQKFNGFKK